MQETPWTTKELGSNVQGFPSSCVGGKEKTSNPLPMPHRKALEHSCVVLQKRIQKSVRCMVFSGGRAEQCLPKAATE